MNVAAAKRQSSDAPIAPGVACSLRSPIVVVVPRRQRHDAGGMEHGGDAAVGAQRRHHHHHTSDRSLLGYSPMENNATAMSGCVARCRHSLAFRAIASDQPSLSAMPGDVHRNGDVSMLRSLKGPAARVADHLLATALHLRHCSDKQSIRTAGCMARRHRRVAGVPHRAMRRVNKRLEEKRMKRTDSDIRDDIQAELKWDPRVHDSRRIGVAVRNGVATLTGTLENYSEKWAAERGPERIPGVRAIASELVVRPLSGTERSDENVADAVVHALRASLSVPHDRITAVVSKGWVTLDGVVDHHYQREAAEQAVRVLDGVKGIANLITVKPAVNETVVKADIEAALKRIAEVDARGIKVHADGHAVTLTGEVRSAAERRAAERVTWAAPGVFEVDNRISVGR